MKTGRLAHIVLTVLAVLAAAMLFVTYGTVLLSTPFSTIRLDGPIAADSNGTSTAIVDTDSSRALILNAEGDLTGVVSCTTIDSPFNAITDVRIVDEFVFLAGVSFAPDSDMIENERVAYYDKGGNFQGVVFERPGTGATTSSIKSLSSAPDGVALACVTIPDFDPDGPATQTQIEFNLITADEVHQLDTVNTDIMLLHDVTFSPANANHYVTLDAFGALKDSVSEHATQLYSGHVFTTIDIDDAGVVYACDDKTGGLYKIDPASSNANLLVSGDGRYHEVHENEGTISLSSMDADKVTICDTTGAIASEFTEVKPSAGFSIRMLLVWVSGIYLVILAVVLAVRKLYRLLKEGRTEGFGPMFLAVAVVSAISIAIASLSFSSYQNSLQLRANEINMCADYLETITPDLSEPMGAIKSRDALREEGDAFSDNADNILKAIQPAFTLVNSASSNGIGMYFNLYGRDDKGIYYLYGSADEYVLGTSASPSDGGKLEEAFEKNLDGEHDLLSGRTLRDATQYRLVQIPTPDRNGVAGVIEIGSKMRSLESSLAGDQAQRILALLVMVLVVYLAYAELRACSRCLFAYQQRQQADTTGAIAMLTRPFTLAITLLSSIDSVMTVLIARDLLARSDLGTSSPFLALPAVMLGLGLIIGHGLYSITGSRVGLRRLITRGALAMFACACLTGAAVAYGNFWLYCAAKLAMSVPFGLLYTLGFSLPRLANGDDERITAAGGVIRTDTSGAALGMVLGGYAAQGLGNGWVYALVAIACIPLVIMALNLLPRGVAPLESMAQPEPSEGQVRSFLRTPMALAIALLVVLPATVAAGYASFLFPLFSVDLGLSKSDINNIVVLGQLIVFVCINQIDRLKASYGILHVTVSALALLGAVFLLFSVNTTLVWSFAVIALVALLCKSTENWKALWMAAAAEADVATGRATSAMFSTRSLALVAQPFILGALLGATDSVAVIVIGVFCLVCAALFTQFTRQSFLKDL